MDLVRTYPRFTRQSKGGKISGCAAAKCWVSHQGKMRPFLTYANWLDAHRFDLPVLLILYLPLLPLHLYSSPTPAAPLSLPGKGFAIYTQSLSLVVPWPHGSCQAEAPFTICQQVRKLTAPRKGNLMHKFVCTVPQRWLWLSFSLIKKATFHESLQT